MEKIYHSPPIRFGPLVRKGYWQGLVFAILHGFCLCLSFRIWPTHSVFREPQIVQIMSTLVMVYLLGIPTIVGAIVLHNLFDRRIRFVVCEHGVWIEKIGRESRLWRWNQITRACDIRKSHSIGLYLQNKALPVTISGFDASTRTDFVETINREVEANAATNASLTWA